MLMARPEPESLLVAGPSHIARVETRDFQVSSPPGTPARPIFRQSLADLFSMQPLAVLNGSFLLGHASTSQRPNASRTNQVHDAVASDDKLSVAIVGTPRFTGPLMDVAASLGTARALLEGYRTQRQGVLSEIHGAFALAIFDEEHDEAILAIDRLGIGSLCYAHDGSRLDFAIGADQVAASGGAGAIDRQSVFRYLFHHAIPGPATVFQGVERLLPGHCLRFGRAGAVAAPYWTINYEESRHAALPELKREFLDTVRNAVADSAAGAKRPGAFLSGGTDSSTIAGMLGEVTGAPARTYSIGFDAEGFDEMGYARIAARHFKTDHHEYYITPDDLVESIPKIAAAYDQPFGNSSALPTYYCARTAEADGIDVMLGGDGGDELFGGNTRYAKQRVFSYYEAAPKALRTAMEALLRPEFVATVPLAKKARSYVEQANVPMPDRLQTYNQLMRLGYANILKPGFLAEVDVEEPLRAMRDWYLRSEAKSLVNRMLALDMKYTLADNDLPKVVRTCELAGVAAAFPFLDDRVVAFSTRLAPELKLKRLQLRWFFKEALRGFLPDAILAKSKHGFGLPFGIWLMKHDALRDLAFGSLESLKQRDIVKPEFLDRLRSDLLKEHASYYGELVWVLMMLEQWFLAHRPTSPLPGQREPNRFS